LEKYVLILHPNPLHGLDVHILFESNLSFSKFYMPMKYYIIVQAQPSSMASLSLKNDCLVLSKQIHQLLIDANLCIYNIHVVVVTWHTM